MRPVRAPVLALCHCVLWLGACGGAPETREAPAAESSGAPDLARGELLSFACQACHTLDAGGAHLIGPNLHGVFGRRAGTAPGFEYSRALSAANVVWTEEAVDAWLADPTGYIDGTSMAFTGYQSPRDRRDLIAFLAHATRLEGP